MAVMIRLHIVVIVFVYSLGDSLIVYVSDRDFDSKN